MGHANVWNSHPKQYGLGALLPYVLQGHRFREDALSILLLLTEVHARHAVYSMSASDPPCQAVLGGVRSVALKALSVWT
ncbi:hypothetical protein CYMTET_17738 [Cymbomonas tetramitiformis]|uniref:Uncharacterized protein n=1 Tax=Cymbomonas tetramitiformis TaxID=36881 RepID=A0AAE0L709_9CHLO|nr:hypothetical protein CYMTET_17738 [Cymbomonas tetramitiformis]